MRIHTIYCLLALVIVGLAAAYNENKFGILTDTREYTRQMELSPQVVNKDGKIQKGAGSYRYKPKTRTERLAQRWERFLEKFDWQRAIGESVRDYQQDSTKYTALRNENILSNNFKGLRLMQQSNVELERQQDGQKQWGTFKRLLWRFFDNFVDDHVPMLQKAKEIPLFKHLVSAFYRSL